MPQVSDGIVEAEGEDKNCLGEWSTPGETLIPPRFVNTYFYGYCASLMENIAEVLEKEEERQSYRFLKENTIQAFRREFFGEETGQYSTGAQGSEAFAYKLGSVKDQEKEQVFRYMAKHVARRNVMVIWIRESLGHLIYLKHSWITGMGILHIR